MIKTTAYFIASCAFCLCFAAATSADDSRDKSLRAELENTLALCRLHEVGSELALNTYQLYREEFSKRGSEGLEEIAASFFALAALELQEWDSAVPSISKRSSEQNRWMKRLSSKDEPTASARGEARDEIFRNLRNLLDNQKNESWQVDWDDAPSDLVSMSPTLTLRVLGDVEVEYQFFDVGRFRKLLDESIRRNRETTKSDSGLESALVSLWHLTLEQDWIATTSINESIQSIAKQGKLTGEQKEEWQYLLAAIAAGQNQEDVVAAFIKQRLTKPPTSLWAMRALNLTKHDAKAKLSVLHQVAQDLCDGAHPFSRNVMSNEFEQISHVLDRYWSIAWAHTEVQVQEHGRIVQKDLRQPAMRGHALVSELVSPTVMESWKPLSLLRVATILRSSLLVGDTESWQLLLHDGFSEQYPVCKPLIRMSRDYSGLRRTQLDPGAIERLAEYSAGDVVALLWGDSQRVSVTELPSALPENSRRIPWVVLVAVGITMVATAVFIIRRGRVSAR